MGDIRRELQYLQIAKHIQGILLELTEYLTDVEIHNLEEIYRRAMREANDAKSDQTK